MTPEQFTYWLQGFAEVSNSKTITEQQWKIIQDHLKLVFNKVTPTYPKDNAVPYTPPYKPFEINPLQQPWDKSPFNPPYRITCASPLVSAYGGYNPKLGGGGAC